MFSFLHNFHPQPIALAMGSVRIYWYGLLMMMAVFAGIFLVIQLGRRYGVTKDQVYDAAFLVVIFSLVGARVYAVLLFPRYYFENPLEIVQVWKGGLAIHGAIVGGALALYFWTKKHRQTFWLWADLIVPALALGQALGRWGNYFNQELFGRPTGLPWGIPIDPFNRPAGFGEFEYFHPTFLYESILNLTVFIILLTLHVHTIKKSASGIQPPHIPPLSKGGMRGRVALQAGNITFIYLIFYSIIRISMEQFRIDETPLFFGVRFPIVMSLGMIAVAIFFLWIRRRTPLSR